MSRGSSVRTKSYWWSCLSLVALIALCVSWELVLAPLRPNGSWMVLKVAPLLAVLMGVFKGKAKTFQVVSLLVWLYVTEGATRLFSDPSLASRQLAGLELVLCLILFVSVSLYARTFKKPKTLAQA